MTPVKKRAYSSPVRQEQAALNWARILDAAGELFVSEGHGRTTVRQIAEAAQGTPVTVHAVFGSKAKVLTALIDQRLAPAPGVENVPDRPEAMAVREETVQRRQIHRFARDMAAVSKRVRPVYEILRTASAVEPEMAAARAEMDVDRLRNMHQAAEWMAARGPLRVDVARAGGIIWTLASPDVSRMLCDDRGWSVARDRTARPARLVGPDAPFNRGSADSHSRAIADRRRIRRTQASLSVPPGRNDASAGRRFGWATVRPPCPYAPAEAIRASYSSASERSALTPSPA